jgi:hypothetical protein
MEELSCYQNKEVEKNAEFQTPYANKATMKYQSLFGPVHLQQG